MAHVKSKAVQQIINAKSLEGAEKSTYWNLVELETNATTDRKR